MRLKRSVLLVYIRYRLQYTLPAVCESVNVLRAALLPLSDWLLVLTDPTNGKNRLSWKFIRCTYIKCDVCYELKCVHDYYLYSPFKHVCTQTVTVSSSLCPPLHMSLLSLTLLCPLLLHLLLFFSLQQHPPPSSLKLRNILSIYHHPPAICQMSFHPSACCLPPPSSTFSS